jgi:hypothetical protein
VLVLNHKEIFEEDKRGRDGFYLQNLGVVDSTQFHLENHEEKHF